MKAEYDRLGQRSQQLGAEHVVIGEQLIWHKGSSTFKATGKRFARYFDSRNLVYLLRKHDGARLNHRTRRETAKTCFLYLYFRYCHEREDGHPDALKYGTELFMKTVERFRELGAPGMHIFVIADTEGATRALTQLAETKKQGKTT